MKTSGMKTAASDNVIERIVKLISWAPAQRRLEGRLPVGVHPSHAVLEEDNGVIDEEADGEREREQREIVDAVIEQLHHGEGDAAARAAARPRE